MLDFTGKTVIVTGAGRGIGRAHALLLAGRGANVVVNDLGGDTDGGAPSPGPAARAVEEITAAGGSAVANSRSVATTEGARSIVDTALEAFGRIDALINNAGNYRLSTFEDLTLDTVQAFLDVHYKGALLMAEAAWPHLVEAGEGRIVNTVSAALMGVPDMVHYGSAKGAVYGFTRNLAVAGAAHGIKVNAVAPGAGTRMMDVAADALPPGTAEYMKEHMPPEMVAPVAAYLAHPACSLTGEVLNAAGGTVSRQVMMTTPGIHDPALTPETVADRIKEICDPAEARVTELMGVDEPEAAP
ncbi:short-chain dehydrogenase [Actinomadura sp. CNU-125]|uniref:SDR family NAD(P)-dependent oxidoreductase n=1 Tax=Actinomadura sp. CNU-125 TaxID=1904961 RepID=UPI000960F014|nr:SDR family NAD(P)-dependent oxidoreductase [Actinomadura sp. CNU-125]OLT37728.1 short-chain dehydrogenase [Actinomadura sp. CNU-125]